ncbi:MAG: type II secretion system protein N [Hyphomonas sp.]
MRLPSLDMTRTAALTQAGRSAAEGMLALAAGLMLARLAWIAAGPEAGAAIPDLAMTQPASVTETQGTPSDSAILISSNPFRPGAVSVPVTAIPTSLNLRLTGLRSADGDDQGGTAVIILPDGQQKRFTTGEIVVPGAVLEAVTADRVFLRVNGQLEELSRLPGGLRSFAVPPGAQATTQDAAAPPPAPPSSIAASSVADESTRVTPALLMSDIALQAETRGGAVSGYRVSPRGAGHFEAAGLESGDIVLRINGQSIEGMRPDMIQSSLVSSDDLALDVVRRGMIVRLQLSAESGLSQ